MSMVYGKFYAKMRSHSAFIRHLVTDQKVRKTIYFSKLGDAFLFSSVGKQKIDTECYTIIFLNYGK